VFFAEDVSRAKAQSAAAFSEVFFASLRLCARNILAIDAPWVFLCKAFRGIKNERAQTTPSPLWKDRSGRLLETALSITSSQYSFRLPSKTQGPGSGLRQDSARASWAATWVEVSVRSMDTSNSWQSKFFVYNETCLAGSIARDRGDSINPWMTCATCDSGFGFRRKASAPALRASASASGDP